MTLTQIRSLKQIADKYGCPAHYIPSSDIGSGNPIYVDGVRMSGRLSRLEAASVDIPDGIDVQRWGIGFFFYRDSQNADNPRRISKSHLATIAKIMPIEANP